MINRVGSMMTMFFAHGPIRNYDHARHTDVQLYTEFFHNMLRSGVYLAPSAFEAAFVSLAHTDEDIRFTVDQARKSFALLAGR